MNYQEVAKSGGAVNCLEISVVVRNSLVVIKFVIVFVKYFPVIIRLEGYFIMNQDTYEVTVILLNQL